MDKYLRIMLVRVQALELALAKLVQVKPSCFTVEQWSAQTNPSFAPAFNRLRAEYEIELGILCRMIPEGVKV